MYGCSLHSELLQVLILSYETFRIHERLFHRGAHQCDLLICDEAPATICDGGCNHM